MIRSGENQRSPGPQKGIAVVRKGPRVVEVLDNLRRNHCVCRPYHRKKFFIETLGVRKEEPDIRECAPRKLKSRRREIRTMQLPSPVRKEREEGSIPAPGIENHGASWQTFKEP